MPLFAVVAVVALAQAETAPPEAAQAAPAWRARWDAPPAEDRPLQIVHGVPPQRATPAGIGYYRDLGLGGLVTNVAFNQYLQSEAHWKTLVEAVEACRQAGLVVWLYDEDGYPSGAAGGLVLKANPKFEALALAYDPARPEKFVVRPAYEATHASNNYHAARRYINIIDRAAVASFLQTTHDAYAARLQRHFGKAIVATFTDEPSLMAVNIGQLPEPFRQKVRVQDPTDPKFVPLPMVPWADDLPALYRQRYGEDLLAVRQSLFVGDTVDDRRTRRQFWSLIADLTAERYYGQIQRWCRRHGLASSGHKLAEESLISHVPLDGNGLAVLRRMDIPGMDLLTSTPAAAVGGSWMAAAMAGSAAALEGRRRAMTEVSDFSERNRGQGPAPLAAMQATAAWQAAMGITEFTLYYRPQDRTADDYRRYCQFVGRLNAVLKPAQPAGDVLLYYPILDLWDEYRPVATPLSPASQSPRARQIAASFTRLGRELVRAQVPFTLVDHDTLAAAKVGDGRLTIAGRGYATLILPDAVSLPVPCKRVVDQFVKGGGRFTTDTETDAGQNAAGLLADLAPAWQIWPPSPWIVLGRFVRDGRPVVALVNVGTEDYRGRLAAPAAAGRWTVLDPANGTVDTVESAAGGVDLALPSYGTRLAIAPGG